MRQSFKCKNPFAVTTTTDPWILSVCFSNDRETIIKRNGAYGVPTPKASEHRSVHGSALVSFQSADDHFD